MPEPLRVLAPIAATFALLLGGMWWAFGVLIEGRNNPNLDVATGPGAPQRVVLERNPAGRYMAPGTINGREVTFSGPVNTSRVRRAGGHFRARQGAGSVA